MISAQLDTVAQEQLIEKYMQLPNQVWDDIISQASKVIYYQSQKSLIEIAIIDYLIIVVFFFPRFAECRCAKGSRSCEAISEYIED